MMSPPAPTLLTADSETISQGALFTASGRREIEGGEGTAAVRQQL
jgi:hypothetical protein